MASEEKLTVQDVRLCEAAACWQLKRLKAALRMLSPGQINECGPVDDVWLPAIAHCVAHTGQPQFHTHDNFTVWEHQEQQSACLRVLLEAKADPNARGEEGECAIHFARAASVVDTLLKAKADINAQDQYGNTVLHQRPLDLDSDLAAYLLEHGADGSLENNDGEKACDMLRHDGTDDGEATKLQEILQNDLQKRLDDLVSCFLDHVCTDIVVSFILAQAAMDGVLETVETLLAVNPCDVHRPISLRGFICTPLVHALKGSLTGRTTDPAADDTDQLAFVKLLLNAKSDPNWLDNEQLTPLAWARTPRIANALIEAKAELNAGRFCPLQKAAYLGRLGVVRLLLERGANPFVADQVPLPENAYLLRRARLNAVWLREFDEQDWEHDHSVECFVQIRKALIPHLFRALEPYLTRDAASIVVPYCLDAIKPFRWGKQFEPLVVTSAFE